MLTWSPVSLFELSSNGLSCIWAVTQSFRNEKQHSRAQSLFELSSELFELYIGIFPDPRSNRPGLNKN